MAGYFSNHSRLHTEPAGSTTHTQTSTPRSSTPASARAPSDPPRPRPAASSRHFSTSLAGSTGARTPPVGSSVDGGSSAQVHPLRTTWVFWFRQQRAPGDKIKNYEEGIKKIGAVSSVESFWTTLTHLSPPSALLPTTDYLLFHAGVRRPIWEDSANAQGGKWILRLRKGVADRVWEDLLLAVVGDQFEDGEMAARAEDGWPEICGVSISVRLNEDIISVWNRYEADHKSRDRLKDALRRFLNLPPTTAMEYKTNNESMQDRSSFRTPVERLGPSGA